MLTSATMRYARVAVDVTPAHLDRPFDYAISEGLRVELGSRVRVTFAGRRRVGWVLEVADTTATDPARVRPLDRVDGDEPWFDADDLRLYRWVARRWGAALAAVLRHALPPRVAGVEGVALTPSAPRVPEAPDDGLWATHDAGPLLAALQGGDAPPIVTWLTTGAADDVAARVADLVRRCLRSARGVLVLAPDPASPLLRAAADVAPDIHADLRAELPDRARHLAFRRLRAGAAHVATGERGAAFAPVRDLGLVVVADEANPAFKERRAPRHHARDVALARARMAGATAVVLGDLPGADLVRLLTERHVARTPVDRGTARRQAPRVEVVDLGSPRPGTRRARFTSPAARAIGAAVSAGGAAVVLAARGGQGAALACTRCGDRRACPVCDASIRGRRTRASGTGAQGDADSPRWECPACDWQGPAFVCPTCGDTRTAPLAAGAGRLAQELARAHPGAEVVRMEGFDAPGPTRRPAVAVMTRGSAVARPGWLGAGGADVVVVPDADALLGLPVLDAAEDALRLWFAVARWTSRVVLQTRDPVHPAVQALVRWDPEGFWRDEAPRRAELRFPPAARLIALRPPVSAAGEVAGQVRAAVPAADDVLGPGPDGGVLVKTSSLRDTLAALAPLRAAWSAADVRVRLDVDPLL